jgi:hypothetical protein
MMYRKIIFIENKCERVNTIYAKIQIVFMLRQMVQIAITA